MNKKKGYIYSHPYENRGYGNETINKKIYE